MRIRTEGGAKVILLANPPAFVDRCSTFFSDTNSRMLSVRQGIEKAQHWALSTGPAALTNHIAESRVGFKVADAESYADAVFHRPRSSTRGLAFAETTAPLQRQQLSKYPIIAQFYHHGL